jgi:hypothetical protein
MYKNLAKLSNYKQKGGEDGPWGKSYGSIAQWIAKMKESDVGEIPKNEEGDDSMPTRLIVIPGFSNESYVANLEATKSLNQKLFKSCHYFKFNEQLRQLNKDMFKYIQPEEVMGNLENMLYIKCSEIINGMLSKVGDSWTVLAKSAGGGVGICLMKWNNIYKKLYLFAPGIKYLANENCGNHPFKDNDNKFDVVIGWNYDDSKVKFMDFYPVIHAGFMECGFRKWELHMYEKDASDGDGHQINSKFIPLVR